MRRKKRNTSGYKSREDLIKQLKGLKKERKGQPVLVLDSSKRVIEEIEENGE